eukprot:s4448_g2.t1
MSKKCTALWREAHLEVKIGYLEWRWSRSDCSLGPVPSDLFGVAKMRLVVMSQGDALEVLRSFSDLPPRDQDTLAEELSLTGLTATNPQFTEFQSDFFKVGT